MTPQPPRLKASTTSTSNLAMIKCPHPRRHRFRPPSDHNAGWGAKLPIYRQKPRTAGLPDDRKHAPRPARSLSPIPVPEAPPPTEVGDAILSDFSCIPRWAAARARRPTSSRRSLARSSPRRRPTRQRKRPSSAGKSTARQGKSRRTMTACRGERFPDDAGRLRFLRRGSATAAAQDFVNGYNALVSTIDELTGTSGALEGDTTANF